MHGSQTLSDVPSHASRCGRLWPHWPIRRWCSTDQTITVALRIQNPQRFASGLIFLAIGAFGIIYGSRYRMGTATHMGPGYFPFVVSSIVALLGLASAVTSLRPAHRPRLIVWHVIPLICVLAGIVAFGLLVEHAGLVLAIAAVVVLGCYQRLLSRPWEVLAIGIILVVMSVSLFIHGLGMPWQAFTL